jgi:hypothetical protein
MMVVSYLSYLFISVVSDAVQYFMYVHCPSGVIAVAVFLCVMLSP